MKKENVVLLKNIFTDNIFCLECRNEEDRRKIYVGASNGWSAYLIGDDKEKILSKYEEINTGNLPVLFDSNLNQLQF